MRTSVGDRGELRLSGAGSTREPTGLCRQRPRCGCQMGRLCKSGGHRWSCPRRSRHRHRSDAPAARPCRRRRRRSGLEGRREPVLDAEVHCDAGIGARELASPCSLRRRRSVSCGGSTRTEWWEAKRVQARSVPSARSWFRPQCSQRLPLRRRPIRQRGLLGRPPLPPSDPEACP